MTIKRKRNKIELLLYRQICLCCLSCHDSSQDKRVYEEMLLFFLGFFISVKYRKTGLFIKSGENINPVKIYINIELVFTSFTLL